MTLFGSFQLLKQGFGPQGRYSLESDLYLVFFMPIAAVGSFNLLKIRKSCL